MRKSTIRLIIILMSISMIGLIIFQIFWIDKAIHVNNIQFRQNVHKALNNVVNSLEKTEVYYTASRYLSDPFGQPGFLNQDSNYTGLGSSWNVRLNPGKPLDSGEQNAWSRDIIVEDSVVFGEQQIKISYHLQDGFVAGDDGAIQGNIQQDQFEMNIQSFRHIDQEVRKSIQKFARKSHMVTTVLDDLLSNRRSIQNRIRKNELEDLLKTELQNMGIDLDFQYAVHDRNRNEFLFSNYIPENEPGVLASDFTVKLFPTDIHAGNHFLTVFFPDQSRFLIKQIWLTLTSSVLLVILIIFCFAYAIFAILRQKKLSEIKNDFINNMTHEFKTPISTVSLACEALRDEQIQKNETFVNNYIRIIEDENTRLKNQVENVLQLASLDKNELKLKWKKLDVHTLIDRAIHNIRLQVDKKGGHIEKKFLADNHVIESDEVHLTNIIYNLLDNANKYSKDHPEIYIQTEDHHQGILLRITDKGIGMSPDQLNKIFDKFYRIPTGNLHDVKGFGLGLAYVKTMVTALGGFIKVKSNSGNGSTFEVILPLKGHGQN